MRTEARYPGLAAGAGHYESFFLRANRPSGGESVWIRYTIDRAPGADATASLWLTWFDAASPAPIAAKASFPPRLVFPPGGYITIGEASLTPGRAIGAITGDAGELGWDLRFDDGADAFDHLSRSWMYSGSFPRTKVRSPYPSSRFSGVLRLGDRTVDIDGWPGMLGHNWGSEHAERWIWIDATGIDGGHGFLDLAAGRVRVAGRLLPWIANGVIEFEGKRHRLGGFSRIPSFHVQENPSGATFKVAGGGIVVHGQVEARATQIATWRYEDPSGGAREVRNGGIANLELTAEQTGETKSFSVSGSATYEVGRLEGGRG